jgi:hypothetical protein
MAYRRIHSKGTYRYEEAVAAGTISPGMVCELTTAGTAQAHSTAGGRGENLIAQEDALQGKTVSDDYSAGDVVGLLIPVPGTEMNVLFGAGESADINDEIVSAGDGTFQNADNLASAALNKQVRAVAVEAFTALAAAALKRVRFV